MALVTVGILFSCGNSGEKDSAEIAEDMNDQALEGTRMKDDAEFAVWAADGGIMEVRMGQLAAEKASSPQVKQFASAMVEDHSKASEELKSYASSRNIVLPEMMSEDKQRKYDELAQKSGADFDRAYIDFMVKDHKEDIDEYQEQSREATDPELRSWAQGKVPVLQHHLEMAQAAQDALKK